MVSSRRPNRIFCSAAAPQLSAFRPPAPECPPTAAGPGARERDECALKRQNIVGGIY